MLASAPGLTSLQLLAPLQPSWLPDLAEVPNLARFSGSVAPGTHAALHTLRLERSDLLADDDVVALSYLPKLQRLSLRGWPAARSLPPLDHLDLRALQLMLGDSPRDRRCEVKLGDLPCVERLSVTSPRGFLLVQLGFAPALRHLQVSGMAWSNFGLRLETLSTTVGQFGDLSDETWANLGTLVLRGRGTVRPLGLPAGAAHLSVRGLYDDPEQPVSGWIAVLTPDSDRRTWSMARGVRLPAHLRVC